MHTLTIKLHGEFCNEYPNLLLEVNNNEWFNGYLIDKTFTIPLDPNGTKVYIEHYGKCFGKSHRWDTKVDNNIIVQDRKIVIDDILIDDISFKSALYKIQFIQHPKDKEPNITIDKWDGTFNFNGSIMLNIDSNPLSWVTNLIYKKPVSNLSYFSNHSKLFHYEEELVIIEEIEKCLKKLQ